MNGQVGGEVLEESARDGGLLLGWLLSCGFGPLVTCVSSLLILLVVYKWHRQIVAVYVIHINVWLVLTDSFDSSANTLPS
jgi:hypothetical protein